MKIKLDLNTDCLKLLPKVDHVFKIEDDSISLLLFQIFGSLKKTTGLKSFKDQCMQVTFYEMPNGKVCACAYPSSVKVDYDKFDKAVKKLFDHVDRTSFDSNAYSFFLYLKKNGYKSKI